MTVYIEFVIIDNLVITGFIALVSYRVLRVAASKKRIACASITATAVAVFYPFLAVHIVWLILIRIVLGTVLSLILFYKKAKLLRGAAVFLGTTFAVAGLTFMIGFIFIGDAAAALITPLDFPIGGAVLILAVVYYPIKRLVRSVAKARVINDYNYDFELTVFDRCIKAKGFMDSGNLLCDQSSGLPVVVAGATLSMQLLTEEQLLLILTGHEKEVCKSARYMEVGTIGKDGKILLIKPKKFMVFLQDGANILREVMLGLSFNDLGGMEALLSPMVVG